jgi:hypothetical protein
MRRTHGHGRASGLVACASDLARYGGRLPGPYASGMEAHGALNEWQGDFDELVDRDVDLRQSASLCDQVFITKQEAYLAGRYVAEAELRAGSSSQYPR